MAGRKWLPITKLGHRSSDFWVIKTILQNYARKSENDKSRSNPGLFKISKSSQKIDNGQNVVLILVVKQISIITMPNSRACQNLSFLDFQDL